MQTKTGLRKTMLVEEQFPKIGSYRGNNFILIEKNAFLSLLEMKCFRNIMKGTTKSYKFQKHAIYI